jgi:hypothetical protein
MAGAWPDPKTSPGFLVLLAGATLGLQAGLFITYPGPWVAAYVLLAILLFSLSMGASVHRHSPRLALLSASALAIGGGINLAANVLPAGMLHPTAFVIAWLGVAGFAATQWFDPRTTYGLSGLGLVASALGALTLALAQFVAFPEASAVANWPLGQTLGPWIVAPWRLAWLGTMAWFLGNMAWLLSVHLRAHRPAAAAQPS